MKGKRNFPIPNYGKMMLHKLIDLDVELKLIGEKTNIPWQNISNAIHGKRNFNMDKWERILNALEFSEKEKSIFYELHNDYVNSNQKTILEVHYVVYNRLV